MNDERGLLFRRIMNLIKNHFASVDRTNSKTRGVGRRVRKTIKKGGVDINLGESGCSWSGNVN